MASEKRHNGGGTGPFTFDFPSLEQSDIKVSVGNAEVTSGFSINNYDPVTGGDVTFTSNTASGTNNVRIYRQTEPETLAATFVAGSSISANDLNNCNKQTIFLADENRTSINSLALGNSGSAIVISGTNIADNSISSSKIVDLEVKTADIDDLAVTTGKIADDAVTTDKLANSINTTIAGKANTGANLSTFTNDTNYITVAQVPSQFTTGMIMMFTGSSAPSGWAFCDGNNGTPDLRNRFIVGAGSTYSSGDTGGANTVTLSESQMPSHNHTFSGSNTHKHNFTGAAANDHNDSQRNAIVAKNDIPQSYMIYTSSSNTGVQNTTITISGNTGNKGSGSSHENRPPYYALSYIMKL